MQVAQRNGGEAEGQTGNYYYRHRYYHSKQGRFMSNDPIGYGDGLNMYAYAGNDPVNRYDPMGLDTEEITTTADRLDDNNCTGLCIIGKGWVPSDGQDDNGGSGGGSGGGGGVTEEITVTADRIEATKASIERYILSQIFNSDMFLNGARELWDNVSNELCEFGNELASISNDLTKASTTVLMSGVVVAASSAILGPEMLAPSVAMIATGSTGGLIAGGFQLVGGLLQGQNTGDYRNAGFAAMNLGVGRVLAGVFKVPDGYRTVSQRIGDRVAQNAQLGSGATYDILASLGSANAVDCK